MLLLVLLIGAVLLRIMDVNHPQRGRMEVGVAPLERVEKSLPAAGSMWLQCVRSTNVRDRYQ